MKIPALIGLVSGGLLFAASGLRVAAATTNETTAAPAQATSTYSSAAPTKYLPIKSLKKVSYYTQMGANNKKNYNVYKSGAAKTSAANMKAIAKGSKWANKEIHITREERTQDGLWLKFTYRGTTSGWIHEHGTNIKNSRKLYAPLIGQRPELPTGCEITAVTMMLQYKGVHVTKTQLANAMPRSSNPNKGFVGDPYKASGLYVYPKGLLKTVKKYGGSSKDLTGASFGTFKKYIKANKPVVVWLANVDGFPNHAITLTGYSSTRAYYNDPWTKKRTSMKLTSFKSHRKADAYRALSY